MTELLHVDASYTAVFERPAFALPTKWAAFSDAAYDRFAPYVRPEEISFDGNVSQPSDFVAKCDLLALNALVRLRLKELNVWTRNGDMLQGSPPAFRGLIASALAILEDIDVKVSLHAQTFTYAEHVRLAPDRGGYDGMLTRWVTGRQQGLAIRGVNFTIPESQVSVTIEPSALFPDNDTMFVKTTSSAPGEFAIADAYDAATAGFRRTFALLGLTA